MSEGEGGKYRGRELEGRAGTDGKRVKRERCVSPDDNVLCLSPVFSDGGENSSYTAL